MATSVAGIVGLACYLTFSDWVIAVFVSIITFPIVRLVYTALHKRTNQRTRRRLEREEYEQLYDRLTPEEKDVISAFVLRGGTVLKWGDVNQMNLPSPGLESLVQRGVLETSMTADGMTETFVLDTALFDVGQDKWEPPF